MYAITTGQCLQNIVVALAHPAQESITSHTWFWVMVAATPQLLLMHIPTMAKLWWVCLLGSMAVVGYTVAIVVYGIQHGASGVMIFVACSHPCIPADPAVHGAIAGTPGVGSYQQAVLVCTALGNIATSYIASKILVEIQAGIKAAPHPTNVPRSLRSVSIAIVVATAVYLLVAGAGYVSTGGQCDNVLQCMTDDPALSVWGSQPSWQQALNEIFYRWSPTSLCFSVFRWRL